MEKLIYTHALAACSLALASVMLSCSSEADELNVVSSEPEEMTEEMLEKIAYGCDSYLYENPTDQKVETSASDEYLAFLRARCSRANKSIVAADDNMIGVIKSDKIYGCGKYKEVEVYYDCEDSGNNNKSKGYHGSWSVSHNLTMRFCIVPANLFEQVDVAYGVVDFSSAPYLCGDSNYEDIVRVDVRMDSDDSHNPQTCIMSKEYGASWVNGNVGSVQVYGNKNLQFRLFIFKPKSGKQKKFPRLGFEYGVLGNVYSHSKDDYDKDEYGYVYSDDEDSNNANGLWVYDKDSGRYDTYVYNKNVYGVIHQDKNTRFYLSKVK
ncbi:MAG: hypothetical protein MJZ15_00930 [Bacteroidales bacterium]|nr:hypothetical protein [Bacteroidales bacterium]